MSTASCTALDDPLPRATLGMRFARFAIGSTIGYGTVEDDGRLRAITTTPFLP